MASPVPTFSGVVRSGQVEYDRPYDRRRYLSGLEGQRVDETVRKHRSKRSSKANRRHFAMMQIAASQLGYDDPYDLHDGLAYKFLALPPDPRTGLPRRRRTPNTDTAEFAEFSDKCYRYLIEIPDVDLSGWDDMEQQMERNA